MRRLRILCAHKETNGHFKGEITRIGGVNSTGEKWNISIKEAIEGIQLGNWELYVVDNFEEIKVYSSEGIEKFLVANLPGNFHNLLEDLPICP